MVVIWEWEITVQSFHRKETTLAHGFFDPIPAVGEMVRYRVYPGPQLITGSILVSSDTQ